MSSHEQQANNALQVEQASGFAPAPLEVSIRKLAKAGGFVFLESTIDGVQNLNPERKARKQIFLTESEKKQEREALKKRLQLWVDLLQTTQDVSEMVEKSEEKAQNADKLLQKNLKNALDATRGLEESYRTLGQFFKNTELDKVKNVSIVNATMEQLSDLDNPRFIDFIADEFRQNYDKLDLRDNYSLMVLPGYVGSNKVLEKWGKLAHENKVMLVTDFANMDKPDDVIEMFSAANLTGGDLYRSNVMMTCNYLVGRGKIDEVGEEEHLYIPGSSSLAGKIYSTLMSQVAAGKKHGGMNEVDSVRFDLKKSEISHLEKIGLVPMVAQYGKVMAFSAKTLFNGDNLGLQTYSVVRVFDYITKVLFDFLNRRAFENWNSKTEADLRSQIVRFLESVKGPDKLIERFRIMRFERDEQQKDRILLDIHITPYFPAKSFVVKLDGHKGEDENATWNTEYEQN
ncbi:DUF5458 family protein [Taibaiella soli]|uniref:Type VI secretion system contractile sheath protein TssC n=1 Tax=Taibaiella soli TaxID=1649169 RepID=A0A2W2B017_9BACT|nr:DUF5458 family protein [Taibaiella soli]PZF73594.1 type VI secretion system contractile sheath protein TssC [Taibaiella soli]